MAEEKEQTAAAEERLRADLGSGPSYFRSTLITLLVLVVAGGAVFLWLFTVKVEPWEAGLRYWYIYVPFLSRHAVPVEDETAAGRKFVNYETLTPGYCLYLPYLTEIFKYDRSVQRLDLPLPSPRGEQDVLRIRTSRDNMEFDVYATILYRIDPVNVRGIKQHYQTIEGIRDKGVKAEFRGRLVSKLSEIETAGDFYGNATLVRKKAEEAIREMNEYFQKNHIGIKICEVLVWDYQFPTEIEASIISKVVASEKIEMEKALSQEAENRAELERLLAEAEAAYEQELARGEARSREIEAEARAEYDKAIAVGHKKILAAKAAGLGRLNQALAGRGGRTYVGLELAEVLKGINLLVLPASGKDGLNPLQLDSTIRALQPPAGPGGASEVNP